MYASSLEEKKDSHNVFNNVSNHLNSPGAPVFGLQK